MSAPQRIQLSRRKGYRKPEGAVVVARPSKWGNPFRVERTRNPEYVSRGAWYVDDGIGVEFFADREDAAAYAVELHRSDLLAGRLGVTVEDVKRELAGRDLACWCSGVCHGDNYLSVANGGEPQ